MPQALVIALAEVVRPFARLVQIEDLHVHTILYLVEPVLQRLQSETMVKLICMIPAALLDVDQLELVAREVLTQKSIDDMEKIPIGAIPTDNRMFQINAPVQSR